MAKETIAQRKEREAAENAIWRKEFAESYAKRLTKLVYEFSHLPQHDARFSDNAYLLTTSPAYDAYYFMETLEPEFDNNRVYEMEQAERSIEQFYEKEAELQRKALARITALNKLNKEERELLGLK